MSLPHLVTAWILQLYKGTRDESRRTMPTDGVQLYQNDTKPTH